MDTFFGYEKTRVTRHNRTRASTRRRLGTATDGNASNENRFID